MTEFVLGSSNRGKADLSYCISDSEAHGPWETKMQPWVNGYVLSTNIV